MKLDYFYERLELFIEGAKFSQLATGANEILIPGEIEPSINLDRILQDRPLVWRGHGVTLAESRSDFLLHS
jgi:hypothetical protein